MALVVKHLGLQPYEQTFQAMQQFTDTRDETTADQIWVVQHPPVFTQGLNGKPEHLIAMQDTIPLVQTDRGGQVTYHGPGQLIIYLMIDLKRAKLSVRDLVHRMEQAIINLLNDYQLQGQAREDAPGVYVNQQKIASLGLKVRKHRSYHGLALNVDMDLTPFEWINPCGLSGMQMTQISSLVEHCSYQDIEQQAIQHLRQILQPEVT